MRNIVKVFMLLLALVFITSTSYTQTADKYTHSKTGNIGGDTFKWEWNEGDDGKWGKTNDFRLSINGKIVTISNEEPVETILDTNDLKRFCPVV